MKFNLIGTFGGKKIRFDPMFLVHKHKHSELTDRSKPRKNVDNAVVFPNTVHDLHFSDEW